MAFRADPELDEGTDHDDRIGHQQDRPGKRRELHPRHTRAISGENPKHTEADAQIPQVPGSEDRAGHRASGKQHAMRRGGLCG